MTGLADLIQQQAFALLLVLARVGPIFVLLPGLGEASAPSVLKAGLALTVTILLLPGVEPLLPPMPDSNLRLALMVAAELGDGIWFGWLVRIIVGSLALAGQFIADCAGLSNVLLPTPETGAQTTAIARLHEIAVPALILSSGLHTLPLSALAGFYQVVPPGTTLLAPDSAALTVTAVADSFSLALRLASPFVLTAIAWNVAIGLTARLVPRLQVYFVALPGQIGLALLLFAWVVTPMLAAWMDAMRDRFGGLPGLG